MILLLRQPNSDDLDDFLDITINGLEVFFSSGKKIPDKEFNGFVFYGMARIVFFLKSCVYCRSFAEECHVA
ncbi:MAG: hypothetical protein LBQ50_00665 [Planctomycetaceae bacterium]|jgi:hypothetical protein|nr:hypothetical protein [Planctomycetaceae bacterium]